MLDGLRDLVELARLDSELTALEAERAGLPQKLAACAEERVAAQERLEAARAALVEVEQGQRQAEVAAQDQEAELARLESQQHQVKTNTAYTALLGEMDRARAAISEAETRILEAMETIETSKRELGSVEEQVAGILERIEQKQREYAARSEALDAEIASLGTRRSDHAGGIDAEMVARYDKIATRRTPAIAIVVKDICMGCRVGIPPQLFIEILKGEQLVACGTCTRILIHEDQLVDGSA